jgi:hypothetical protein
MFPASDYRDSTGFRPDEFCQASKNPAIADRPDAPASVTCRAVWLELVVREARARGPIPDVAWQARAAARVAVERVLRAVNDSAVVSEAILALEAACSAFLSVGVGVDPRKVAQRVG